MDERVVNLIGEIDPEILEKVSIDEYIVPEIDKNRVKNLEE